MIVCMANYAQTIDNRWIDGKIFVRFNKNAIQKFNENGQFDLKNFDFMEQIYQDFNIISVKYPFATTKSDKLRRTIKIEFSDYENIDLLIRNLSKNAEIEYAEKIPVFKLFTNPPNDPLYKQNYDDKHISIHTTLYGLIPINIEHDLSPVSSSWHLDLIHAEEAWELQTGNSDIIVADIDNAIWSEHPDLQNVIVHKYNTVDGTNNTTPDEESYEWSHGTHTAGLIGAETNNGIGVASIGNGISIMAIKAGENLEGGVEAISYAVDNGAKVISMSWGSEETDQTFEDAINYAWEEGAILVAAAGNNGDGSMNIMGMHTNAIMYPASYENCIAVGACNGNDKKSVFSQYGTWVDVLAPGGYGNEGYQLNLYVQVMDVGGLSVLSTTYSEAGSFADMLNGTTGGAGGYGINGNYDAMPGTSMACPITAGLCGLIWSANPSLTNEEVRYILESNCDNVDAQNSTFVGKIGHGRINAFKAIAAAKPISVVVNNIKPISIYPNPVENQLNIQNGENSNYEIYDILGKKLLEGAIKENIFKINISNLPAGSFIVTIKNQNNIENFKIVKL